jgi:hypothetical protein
MFDSCDARGAVCIAPELAEGATTSHTSDRCAGRKLLLGLLVILGLLVPFTAAFENAGPAMDEGSLLLYPELIRHGELPYRDFETFYGPANAYVLAATYSIFGPDIMVERTVGLLYRALILSLVFALIARWNSILATGCTVLTAWVLLGAWIVAYAWFGGIACLLGSILLLTGERTNTRAFFAGLLASCALLYRVDLAPAIILSALPLLHFIMPAQRVRYFIGAATGLLPLVLLTCAVGSREMINNLFLYPVVYSSAARHLPMSAVEPYVRALFATHLLAVGFNLVAGIVAVRVQPRELRNRLLLSLALFGAMLTTQAAQRLDLGHLTCAAFLSLGILPLSLLILVARGREWQPRLASILLATIAVLAVLEGVAPEMAAFVKQESQRALFPSEDSGHFVQHAGRSFPCSSRQEAFTVARMLDRLEKESVPGQRMFVGPADLRRTNYCDTFIYHLMPKLQPSSYFLEMNPLSANRAGSRLVDDIRSSDWLVLNRTMDTWMEKNRSVEFQSNAPNLAVRERFQLVGEFGPYLLFRAKTELRATRRPTGPAQF